MNDSFVPEYGPLLTYLGINPESIVSQFNRATLLGHKHKKIIVFGGGNDVLMGPCRGDCYYAHNPNDSSGEYCSDAEALPSLQCQSVLKNMIYDFQTLIVDRASERGVTDIIYVTYPQVPDWRDGNCSSCDELCLGWPINKCLRKNECGNFGAKTTAALHYVRNKYRNVNAPVINYRVVELKPRFLDASGNPDKTLFDRCDGFSGIHPSVQGSQRMAQAIWEAMQHPNGNDVCDDGVQNGDEEGVDCGGSCPDQCDACTEDGHCDEGEFCNLVTAKCEEKKKPDGSFCLHDGACQSGHCRAGFCVQCTEDGHCDEGDEKGPATNIALISPISNRGRHELLFFRAPAATDSPQAAAAAQ